MKPLSLVRLQVATAQTLHHLDLTIAELEDTLRVFTGMRVELLEALTDAMPQPPEGALSPEDMAKRLMKGATHAQE